MRSSVRVARKGACARWSRWSGKSVCPNPAPPCCPDEYCPKGGGRHDGEVASGISACMVRIDAPGCTAQESQCNAARIDRSARNSRCKEACGGFDHGATHQRPRSNFECWRDLGHNLNELSGAKISIPTSRSPRRRFSPTRFICRRRCSWFLQAWPRGR